MHPLTKIKFVGTSPLHPGVERDYITAQITGALLKPAEQLLAAATRTPRFVG
ncbi:MAG: hypothetical protein QG660_1935, partial [Pseudomonadota bacterium]|nr:hypothetical protein [Pseudomonadota bacterium]